MSETTRRVSVTLPEAVARMSKAQAAMRGVTYDQFLRNVIEDTVQRNSKEAAAATS